MFAKWLQKIVGIDLIIRELQEHNKHLEKLSSCVHESSRNYGRRKSITTSHWND